MMLDSKWVTGLSWEASLPNKLYIYIHTQLFQGLEGLTVGRSNLKCHYQ